MGGYYANFYYEVDGEEFENTSYYGLTKEGVSLNLKYPIYYDPKYPDVSWMIPESNSCNE